MAERRHDPPLTAPKHGAPPAEDVRAQLERILSHRDFEATDRTREFLRFVVEETLAGRAGRLKGYTIAIEVFGRPADFDANLDPIVRIQAGRLRRALEHYYLVAGGNDPLRIDVPKGQYVPTFASQQPGSDHGFDGRASTPSPVASAQFTIAVVPFTHAAGDQELGAFCNGLVEELLSELNHYEDVMCIAYRDGGPAEGSSPRQESLSREVGTRFFLDGSVRRDPVGFKVSVHLTDGATGQQVWRDAYRVAPEAIGLIETQEEIADNVASAVAGEYGIVARLLSQEARDRPVAELSAYEALLRYHHYMLVMTPDAGAVALTGLRAVLEREPECGPAWAALANLHCHAVVFDRPDAEGALETAYLYARRAAALSPDSQLARTIMAYVYLLRGELDLFRAEAEVALSLNPNSPNYIGTIGYLYAIACDVDRGRALLDRAIARNPFHPQWFHHGLYCCHFCRGDYQRAYAEALKIGHPPGFWDPCLRAAALGKLGRRDEARAASGELLDVKPDIEHRIRDLLPYTVRQASVADDFIDGLRAAGLRIP